MQKPPIFLLIFFLFFSLSGFSQEVLYGNVMDSLRNPLPLANVIAEPKDTLEQLKFSITNELGRYQLSLKEIDYTIKVIYLGYEQSSYEFSSGMSNEKDFILKKKSEDLEEVVIEMPVEVREDTIFYNVEKITTGEERKLKDILKKLPGVEVLDDGNVTFQGKKINKVLVENKAFFGGDSKLAIDNIPADAIDQVQILENYSDIAILKELQDGNKTAMNIKLKEDNKNFVFGDMESGKGNKDFYRAHANLFYYGPETNLNSIGNINNIGEQVFTYKQYVEFQGGMTQVFKEGNTIFEDARNDLLQFLEKEDVVESNRKFGAFNVSRNLNNKLEVSAYGIFSKIRYKTFSESINQYNTFTENQASSSNNNNLFAIANLKAVYYPNLKDQWHFKTHYKASKNSDDSFIESIINSIENDLLIKEDLKDSYFNQSIEWHRRSNAKNTLSFLANYNYSSRSPKKQWQTSEGILNEIIPVSEDSLYNINNDLRTESNRIDAQFKYYWLINRNHHFYSTIGNTLQYQNFFSEDFQILQDGTMNSFSNSGFGNNFRFNLNDLFIGVNYKVQLGIFKLNQGVFLHNYNWKTSQENETTRSKTVLLPNFSAEAKFSRTKILQFDYELTSSFSEASRYARDFYINSYNSVFRGNNSLENELINNFKLRFSKYSTYRGIRLFVTVNYKNKIKGIINRIDYINTAQSVEPIFIDHPEENFSVYGKVQKKIKDVNFSLGAQYYYSKYEQRVNSILSKNSNGNFSYDFSGKTLFDNFPIIEVGYKQSFGAFTLDDKHSRFYTIQPYLNFDYSFLNGFVGSFDFSSYFYRNEYFNQKNTYEISNASLLYQHEGSAWSFELMCQNLFDVRFKNQSMFSDYIISDSRKYILPRILMFSIMYNL